MIVCICHRVSDRDIARAARQGCANFDELQQALSVATACGRCLDCARDTFHHHTAPLKPESTGAGCCIAARPSAAACPSMVVRHERAPAQIAGGCR